MPRILAGALHSYSSVFEENVVMIISSFEQPAGAGAWLTLVEFRAEVSQEGVSGADVLKDRLAEILIPLSIPEGRLQRIQTAVENAILHAAARAAARPEEGGKEGPAGGQDGLSSVSLRIYVSRATPGEAPTGSETRSLRETLPIWTGGPYGWGFFLVEQAEPVLEGEGGAREASNHSIQLFLYPEGGE
jgi:hypothetical protein